MLTGCHTVKTSTSTTATDTERCVAVTTTTVTLPDSLEVTLPSQSQSVITRDSVSTLINDYAESSVTLNADGSISHSLVSRRRPVKIPIMSVSRSTDSVVTSSRSASTASTTDTHKGVTVTADILLTCVGIMAVAAAAVVLWVKRR
jgi:hypothetical protein